MNSFNILEIYFEILYFSDINVLNFIPDKKITFYSITRYGQNRN